MNRIRFKVVLFLTFLVLLFSFKANGGALDELEKGGPPDVKPPSVKMHVLSNGIRCYLLEDHTLPIVNVHVVVKGGGIYDAPEKVGQAELLGMLMRSGGAGSLTAAQFDAAVDMLGASITSSMGAEMAEVGLRVLSEDAEAGMKLFFDMLISPRFDETRLKVSKLKILEALRRDDDDPDSLVGRKFREQIYGKESPWARRPDGKTLTNVTRSDIQKLHKNYFKTNNMILAASGDFDTEKLIKLIVNLTKDAPSGEVVFNNVPAVDVSFAKGCESVIRPLTQSYIRMGHLGINRHNPDKFALSLMMDILGASNFKSRLMEDIRTRRGMAYSIWADMVLGTDLGFFVVGVDTKNSQAPLVVNLIEEHLRRLKEGNDVSTEELEFAKKSVLSRLVFEFDNPQKVVGKRAMYYFYGYPDDYWRIFRDKISAVDTIDVENVAKKYLHPDGLKIVVVGPKMDLR